MFSCFLFIYQELEDSNERLTVEKRTMEQQLTHMKANGVELEHMLQKSHQEKEMLNVRFRLLIATLGSVHMKNIQFLPSAKRYSKAFVLCHGGCLLLIWLMICHDIAFWMCSSAKHSIFVL